MELAAILAYAVIQADRPDWRGNAEAKATGVMEFIVFMVPGDIFYATPGIAHVGKDDALDLLGNGIAVFDGRFVHLVAAKFIVFIAAQVVGAAESEQVVVGHIAGGDTAHEADGDDVGPADFIVQAVFGNEFEVVEVTAHAVAGPGARKGQALAFRRVVDVVAVIEDVGPGQAIGTAEVII